MQKLFFPILIIFFFGCSSENISEPIIIQYDKFEIEQELIGSKIDWINANSGFDIKIYKDIVAIVDFQNEEGIFHFYDLNNQNKVGSFGRIGKGPGEFTGDPRLLTPFTESSNELFFWICDRNRQEIIQIPLFATLESGVVNLTSKYEVPKIANTCCLEMINDSLIVDIYHFDDVALAVFDLKSSLYDWKVDTKKYRNLFNDNLFRDAELLNVIPSSHKVISGFQRIPRIHVYSSKGELEMVIEDRNLDRNLVISENAGENQRNHPIRFYSILAGKDYFVVIDENRLVREMTPSTLLIFDWKGNPLARYPLKRVIRGYAMEWENNRMIAFDPGNFEFVEYDLSAAAILSKGS